MESEKSSTVSQVCPIILRSLIHSSQQFSDFFCCVKVDKSKDVDSEPEQLNFDTKDEEEERKAIELDAIFDNLWNRVQSTEKAVKYLVIYKMVHSELHSFHETLEEKNGFQYYWFPMYSKQSKGELYFWYQLQNVSSVIIQVKFRPLFQTLFANISYALETQNCCALKCVFRHTYFQFPLICYIKVIGDNRYFTWTLNNHLSLWSGSAKTKIFVGNCWDVG